VLAWRQPVFRWTLARKPKGRARPDWLVREENGPRLRQPRKLWAATILRAICCHPIRPAQLLVREWERRYG